MIADILKNEVCNKACALHQQTDQEEKMITKFLFEGGMGRFSFDYLGPPWAFIASVSLLIVILVLFRSLLKGLR